MKRILATLPLLFIAAEVTAQSPADRAISAVQGANTRTKSTTLLKRAITEQVAPELFPGELDDVGPQFLLMPTQGAAATKHQWFEAFVDTQLYYTSNALLTEKGNRDTSLMVTTIQAAVNFPTFDLLGKQVAAKAGYRHQWWLYSLNDSGSALKNASGSELNFFDFAVSTFFLQARHTFGENWTTGVGLDHNRLLSREDEWAEFYTELVPSWFVERNFNFGEKAALTAGLYGAYHWTHTDDIVAHINDRLDTSFGITYSYELAPGLVAQPYYRIQWSHYTENSDRNDMYNSLGFGLSYALGEAASVRAFVGYENRNSTDTLVADYGKWDSGAGLTLSVKF